VVLPELRRVRPSLVRVSDGAVLIERPEKMAKAMAQRDFERLCATRWGHNRRYSRLREDGTSLPVTRRGGDADHLAGYEAHWRAVLADLAAAVGEEG